MAERTTITVSKATKERLDEQRDEPWDEFLNSQVNSPRMEGRAEELETRLIGVIEAFDAQDVDAMEREIEAARELIQYA